MKYLFIGFLTCASFFSQAQPAIVRSVDTIPQLVALNTYPYSIAGRLTIEVLGRSSSHDGLGGTFALRYSSEPTNNYSVFASTRSGYQWHRLKLSSPGAYESSEQFGHLAVASNSGATALGSGATASAVNSTAIGLGAATSGEFSVAVGNAASAALDNSVVIGDNAIGLTNNVVAVGSNAQAAGNGSVAIGSISASPEDGSIAVGLSSSASGYQSIAIGLGTEAEQLGVAVGAGALATGSSGAIAIGAGADSLGLESIAIGNDASTTQSGVALGRLAVSSGGASTAIGRDAEATADHSVALGWDAVASHARSVAVGSQVETSAADQIQLGNTNHTVNIRGTLNVESGGTVLFPGTGNYSTRIGLDTVAGPGKNTIAIGEGATARASDAISIGVNAVSATNAFRTILIGGGATALGFNGIAIGQLAEVNTNSIIIGTQADVFAENSIGIGHSVRVNTAATNSIAIGTSTVDAANSIALGKSTTASAGAARSISIGNNIANTHADTILIGNGLTSTSNNQIKIGDSSQTTTFAGPLQSAADFRMQIGTIATITNGANVAVALPTTSIVKLTGTATGAFSISGFVGGLAGRFLILYNATGQDMTLLHESGTEATASNRIVTMTGADVVTTGNGTIQLFYDNLASRWVVISVTP